MKSSSLPIPATAPRARLEWLDFYRGLAVLVMIETHVANTFLANGHWPVEWRATLDYVNGLVAPAFLFIAGYAHGCGLRRKRAVRAHVWPRLARLAGIAALGYAMHLPWKELAAGQWSDALMVGSRLDILPCLAMSIAVLVVVDRVCERWVDWAVVGIMIVTVLAAPRLAAWTGGPAPLMALVNGNTGSLFPLLPWTAFVFAGFLLSKREPVLRAFALPVATAFLAVALLGRADLSRASPAFFFERLAWILALVPTCGWIAQRWTPALVLFAGRESLAMYLAHLLLISQLAWLGVPRVGVVPTALLFVAILAATILAAVGWRRFTFARADRARRGAHRPGSSAPAA